jgi:hypothetical protein
VKKRWLRFALTAFVVCVLVAMGCSGGKKPLAKLSDEEAYQRFVGKWVNTDYPGTLEFTQVTVIRPDFVGEDWSFPKSTNPIGEWTIKIKKTWVDEKGNTYLQSYNTRTKPEDKQHSAAALMRVDKKGKVWECCVKPFGFGKAPSFEDAVYPEKIDPNLQWYYIYYRK